MSAGAVSQCYGFLFAAEEYAVGAFHGFAGSALQGAVNFQVLVTGMGDMAGGDEVMKMAMAREGGREVGVWEHWEWLSLIK
jgi:hypothetical protein